MTSPWDDAAGSRCPRPAPTPRCAARTPRPGSRSPAAPRRRLRPDRRRRPAAPGAAPAATRAHAPHPDADAGRSIPARRLDRPARCPPTPAVPPRAGHPPARRASGPGLAGGGGADRGRCALVTAGYPGRRRGRSPRRRRPTVAISGTNTSTSQTTAPPRRSVPARVTSRWWRWPRPSARPSCRSRPRRASARAIVYDSRGLIVTNAHVVGTVKHRAGDPVRPARASGQGGGGRHRRATSPWSRSTPASTKLTAAKLATASPRSGAVTVAIGSPFGLSGTVTAGVVSAVDRPVDNDANVTRQHDPDRRRHQPGQLGRGPGQQQRRGHRGQRRDPQPERREQRHRLRHPDPARRWRWPTRSPPAQSLAKPVIGVQVEDDPNGATGAYVGQGQRRQPGRRRPASSRAT